MKSLLTTALAIFLVCANITFAQAKRMVTDLPDISVIGNFVATSTPSQTSFHVQEIEFSFQHYLYPSVKANIFTALHKEGQSMAMELEEAYVDFSDLMGVLLPNTTINLGIGATIGKKLLNIGKVNPTHPEQWQFSDRPIAIKQFFGHSHGLSAEGGNLSYLLPLPIFSQVELGFWTVAAHEQASESTSHGVEYENRLLSGRLWNSLALSGTQEIELGLNYLLGNATTSSDDDKQRLMGLDFTYSLELGASQALTLQSEFYQANYGEHGEELANQTGGYISAHYKLNSHYRVGLRHGILSAHGDEGNDQSQTAIMLTQQLTDTSKFRLQYNTGDQVENAVYAQFIFGMGPHSHVLQ